MKWIREKEQNVFMELLFTFEKWQLLKSLNQRTRVICVKTDHQLNNVAIAFKGEPITHFIFFFLVSIYKLKILENILFCRTTFHSFLKYFLWIICWWGSPQFGFQINYQKIINYQQFETNNSKTQNHLGVFRLKYAISSRIIKIKVLLESNSPPTILNFRTLCGRLLAHSNLWRIPCMFFDKISCIFILHIHFS